MLYRKALAAEKTESRMWVGDNRLNVNLEEDTSYPQVGGQNQKNYVGKSLPE
jgi:hypothetical protein